MNSEEALIRNRLKAPKAAAIAGILFSVLFIISLVLFLQSIPEMVGPDDSWLTTNRNTLLLAFNLMPFSGIAFLWFMGVVRDRFGEREDRFLGTVFLGSGLLFVAMLFIFAAIAASIVLLYTTEPNRQLMSSYYDFGRTFSREILNTYAVKMAGVFMFSTCTLFIRTKVIPKWMSFLGYAFAVISLLRIHHLDRLGWIALLFPLWILLISVYILIDNYRQKPGTAPMAR